MQNGAPRYAIGDMRIDVQERSIEIIFWFPFSPDLNSIERVWHIMKNYLQDNIPEYMLYDQSREAVKKA